MEPTQEQTEKKASPKKSPVTLWKALRRTFGLSRPHRARLVVALVCTLAAALISLALPLGLRSLLDAVFQRGDRGLLDRIALVLLLLFALRFVVAFAGSFLLDWVGERVISDLRESLYEHLHKLGLRFFAEQRLGELTSRLTNDVGSVRAVVTTALSELLTQGLTAIGSVVLMAYLNWRLCLIMFVTVPVMSVAARAVGPYMRKLSRRAQDQLADATAVAEEALGAARVVKAFAREPYEVGRYRDAVERLFATGRRRAAVSATFTSFVNLLFSSVLLLLFWYGGNEVLAGRLSPGDLVAFLFYTITVTRSVGSMTALYNTFNTATGASERLFELLDTPPEIEDAPHAFDLPAVEGALSFEEVTFEYQPGRPVLRDISFEVRPGERVAIVGPSGAGKTTLLHLIPRFYDLSAGRIRIDGHGVEGVTLRSLREQIGIVPQDIHLFGRSVRENIRYGRLEASDAEVEAAARLANAHDFIESLPEGYETLVGEKGVKLSGGQRQRIAIASALLKDPKILLLDEATSSLDSHSESLVQDALERLMSPRTTFIVAHRLSTVQNAHRILVLEGGRLIQAGTHEELFAYGGLYRQLCDMQFHGAAAQPVTLS